MTKNDLTILYYTDNTISNDCANNVRNNLLKVTKGKYPIVSVSQKPIDFGKNICVGVIGKTHYNCYKQILEGAKKIKTKYVACCEDDALYNEEYFTHRPKTKKGFAYNLNWWYAESLIFWHKTTPNDTGMFQCICETAELVRVLSARFKKYPKPVSPEEKYTQKCFQEPGRCDFLFGIDNAKMEYFISKKPCIVFNYHGSLGGKRGSYRPTIFTDKLPALGKASDVYQKMWNVEFKKRLSPIPRLANRIELAKYFALMGFKKGAEIGVFGGHFSEVLCQNIPGLKLIGVDPWQNKEDTYKTAVERLAPYKVKLIRKTSMEALNDVADNSLDFVFIDGNHTYPFVKEDIEGWYKKVKKGGIVSGHDYYVFKHTGNTGVIDAVQEFIQKNDVILFVTLIDRSLPEKDDGQPSWFFYK